MAETPSKKRKLENDQHNEVKKQKSATERPKLVSVSSVVRPRLAPPVLVTAPGLTLPSTISFKPSFKPVDVVTTKKSRAVATDPDLQLHSNAHRSLDFLAKDDRPLGMGSYTKHYIGIHDPVSGSLKVVEARKMVVRGVVRTRQAPAEAMTELTTKETNYDMRKELGQAFGTKKAKKALKSVVENAIAPERNADGTPKKMTTTDLALMDIIRDASKNIATQEELQATVNEARPVPKGNYDAKDIQDVYDPQEIIGADILNAIPVLDWQAKIKKQENIPTASRFVSNRLNRVAANPNAVQRLKILRYLLLLVVFWATTTKGKGRGAKSVAKRDVLQREMAPAPDVVIDSIRRKFSDVGEMRKIHLDLLATHCCALACIIDNFDTNTLDLRDDLKLEQKQINQYFGEIGARIRQAKKAGQTQNWATLALPLQFPKLRFQRQR